MLISLGLAGYLVKPKLVCIIVWL